MEEWKLILTVGLPKSGKSTWAKKQEIPIVNPDSIRLALHGKQFIAEAEEMVWTIAKYMVKSLFLAGHKEVILDATNITKKRRDQWLSKYWNVYYKEIKTDVNICINRAKEINNDVLITIIDKMNKEYEPLTEDEKSFIY